MKLVHDAVLKACDAQDGLADGIVGDPLACRKTFDASLQCKGCASGRLFTPAQVAAVRTLHADLRMDVELANGLTTHPGRGPGGEAPSFGPTGGWTAWWLGSAALAFPPDPKNGIAWFYGAGAIRYFYAATRRRTCAYRAAGFPASACGRCRR